MEARPARATRKTPLLPVVLTGVQFLDDLAGVRQGQRPGEEVPLRELAAQRLKGRELFLVLHAPSATADRFMFLVMATMVRTSSALLRFSSILSTKERSIFRVSRG